MAFVRLPNSQLYWPEGLFAFTIALTTSGTIDAATEKFAAVGNLWLPAGATSKTISSAGGRVCWNLPTVTFANGATSVTAGIQDLSADLPDGSFDVSGTFVGGGGGIAAGWNRLAMDTGSKTISAGALIAIVLDMTARGGADSINGGHFTLAPSQQRVGFFVGSWTYQTTIAPNVGIEFDDGTVGCLWGLPPFLSTSQEIFNDSTNPDERGVLFQLDNDCKSDGAWLQLTQVTAADGTLTLYSDPLGTPAAVATAAIEGVRGLSTPGNAFVPWDGGAEVSLTKTTTYALALKATSANDLRLQHYTLGNENMRPLLQGGTTVRKGTRNNGAGAFAEESPAITRYRMGIRQSQLPDGASAAGGVIGE